MTPSQERIDRAVELTAELVRHGVQAVCLFGSAARGEAGPESDLDLLVVGEQQIRSRELKAQIPAIAADDQLGLAYATWERMAAPEPRDWVFWSLVASEAVILHDADRRLARAFRDLPHPGDSLVAEHARDLERHLYPQDEMRIDADMAARADGRWWDRPMIEALTNCYRWGKAASMYGNARKGVFEPRRQQALERFAELYPHAAGAAATVASLCPFYQRGMKRDPDAPLPFALTDLDTALAGRAAAAAVIRAAGS